MSGEYAFTLPDHVSGPVSKIVEWLNDSYEVVIDEMDPSKIYVSDKEDDSRQVGFDELYLTMIDQGVSQSETLLRKIVRCNSYFKSVNPVRDYLEKLKGKYQGKSHIDLLCKHLEARDFGDKKKKGFYQDRLNSLVKKWIVSAAACAMGYHVNDVALGFIHDVEGIGKTFLTNFLCPLKLSGFYHKVDHANAIKSGLADLFARKFIVNFDELVGINARRPEDFKQIMSSRDCTIFLPRDPFPRTVPRIASAMFTTNRNAEKGGFITQAMGYRRFGSVELSSINQEYSKVVDVDQIWAEAIMLIDEAFNYRFDMSDFDQFREYNMRYVIEDVPMMVVRTNYLVPDPEETDEKYYRTATQVYTDIVANKKCSKESMLRINPKVIGNALSQLGFPRVSRRSSSHTFPVYVYHIKNISI